MRAISCALVVVCHSPITNANSRVIQHIAKGGWVGVDVFFVLSGFLITQLLLNEHGTHQKINLKRFTIRRALKILPAFYIFASITTIAILFLAQDYTNIRPAKLLAEYLFFQNYVKGVWGHTWSLAVEAHFYIAVVAMFSALSLKSSKSQFSLVPIVSISIAITVLVLRLQRAQHNVSIPQETHLRIDAMFIGVLVAYLQNRHHAFFFNLSIAKRLLWLTAGISLLLPPFFPEFTPDSWLASWGLTTNSIGAACILISCITDSGCPVWLTPVTLFGTHSYSIYLWHAVVVTWIVPKVEPLLFRISPAAPWLVALALSAICGIFATYIFERPVLRMRERVFPSLLNHNS